MCESPYSQQTKAHTYLTQYGDLLDIDFSNPSFSKKNLANATFRTGPAFQMREELMFEKNISWNLDFKGGKNGRYAHFTRHLRMLLDILELQIENKK